MATEKVTLRLLPPLYRAIEAEAAKCDLDPEQWIEASLLTAWHSPGGVKIKIPHAKARVAEASEETPMLPFGQQ